MFISKPSFQAKISNWTLTPGAIYWEAIEVGLVQVWFVVTIGHYAKNKVKGVVRMEREGSTTMLVVNSRQVVSMINDTSEADKVVSVLAVIPPIQSQSADWEMRKALAFWRYQPTPDNDSGEIPYDAIEVEGGDLVPSFPVGEPVDRSRLILVARLSKAGKP